MDRDDFVLPVCPVCHHAMCEDNNCTRSQLVLPDGRCFNCGNIECVMFVLPPCADARKAVPWVL
jgi:hypothetical protein